MRLKRILMFILNEVETSHILISIRLYFILTILITEDGPQPSILSDCNFISSAGEVCGTQGLSEGGLSLYIGTGPREPRTGPIDILFWFFSLLFFLYFQLKSTILRKVSVCPQTPKQYCSALQNFCWRPWYKLLTNHYIFCILQHDWRCNMDYSPL
jgi:hypothetical protein